MESEEMDSIFRGNIMNKKEMEVVMNKAKRDRLRVTSRCLQVFMTTRPVGPRLTALQRTDPNPSIMGTTCPIIRSIGDSLSCGKAVKGKTYSGYCQRVKQLLT
ncbi:hypothetical protein F2Q69_00023752 [Brassica cretica]|uniref:Uncharacterized protein n=1 Tax=Brassica cretica TaxID=69181 RepID=A0A8S9QQH1_BRACR|nr:hypothetical protein F2Q69_00023752 [Brassica cretica]